MVRIGLLVLCLLLGGWEVQAQARRGRRVAKPSPKPAADTPLQFLPASSDSVQTLLANGQLYTVSFGQPELLGKFFDKVGNCDMELFANGYGYIVYKGGANAGKRQDIRWGLRLGPNGRRHQFIDEDGVDTHEFVVQHFRENEIYPSLVGNYSPSVPSREQTPVIIFYEQEWYLERIR